MVISGLMVVAGGILAGTASSGSLALVHLQCGYGRFFLVFQGCSHQLV